MKIPFDAKELEIAYELPNPRGGASTPVFSHPISLFDAVKANLVDHDPIWMFQGYEAGIFCPSVIPDHVARGFCFEAFPTPREKFGGKDIDRKSVV